MSASTKVKEGRRNPKKAKSFSGKLPELLNTEKGTPHKAGMGKERELVKKAGCSWALFPGMSRDSRNDKNVLVSSTKYLRPLRKRRKNLFWAHSFREFSP